MFDYDDLGSAGRDRDLARRQEADLPATGPEAPHRSGLTPADLDAAFGTYQPTRPAAEARRGPRDIDKR